MAPLLRSSKASSLSNGGATAPPHFLAPRVAPPKIEPQDVQESMRHSLAEYDRNPNTDNSGEKKMPLYKDRKEFGLPSLQMSELELSWIRPFYSYLPRTIFGKHPNEPIQPVRITDREFENLNRYRTAHKKKLATLKQGTDALAAMPGASRYYEKVMAEAIIKASEGEFTLDYVLWVIGNYELEIDQVRGSD
ncbi:hypothetical protein BDZ45DRAFT_809088 [Acephala macrosclerotiorum]|nr:hypothetical protein BDZ45DRAFT_809088 [Acephala macrosclerotiorum]